MLLSYIVLAVFCLASFFLTQRSLEFPVFHFLLSSYWVLPFFYWWDQRHKIILTMGGVVFCSWQIYFGLHAGWNGLMGLLFVCIATALSLVAVRKVFQLRIQQRSESVAIKNNELIATKKKYDSRQQSLEHLERQVASLLNLFEMARELSDVVDFSTLTQSLSKTLKGELAFSKVLIWIPQKNSDEGEKAFRILEINSSEGGSIKDNQKVDSALLLKIEEQRQMVRDGDGWYFPAFDKSDLYAVFAILGADEKDLAKIEVLSSFLALLVKKISLYETIRELSIVDDLTQVFVRRHFMERLHEEVRRSQRFKTPLSLLMLDIDHFKRYNDEFGHLVGDATLKKVAEFLKLNVRRVDLVGRYGGEEFIVVMPETKSQAALEVAERIRSYIARHTFKLYHVETKVTVSQGIATYDLNSPQTSETADPSGIARRLIEAADQALYHAKEDGRNRVVVSKAQV